jgi:NtrC-family two-component system response regulator AlgB
MVELPGHRLRILVVDDEANIRITLSMCLEADGHTVLTAGTMSDALEEVARNAFDLIFLDLRLGMDNGLDFIPRLIQENPWAKIIVITAYASVDTAVQAMKRGATDYLPKPFEPAQVQLVTQKVAERRLLELKIQTLQSTLGEMDPELDFPTADPVMRQTIDLARQVSSSNISVLIRGEIGTGKARLARAIHALSSRAAAPFSAVSCQAISSDALEAELFGLSSPGTIYLEKSGRVAFCDGGTLLLDEIGEIPMRLQPKILRLVRDKEFERLDDFTRRTANVRVLATTTSDLSAAATRGNFRTDLLLALDVVEITVPPLRQRQGDISLLAERYLAYFGRENHRPIAGFTADASFALAKHTWPGNVRELRNVIERAVLLCNEDRINVKHLPPNLNESSPNYNVGDLVDLQTISELHIQRVIDASRSVRRAASILGIDPATLYRRMKRQGVKDEQPAD